VFDYVAHGLSISSQIELPAFDRVEHETPSDLVVRVDLDVPADGGVLVVDASVSERRMRIHRLANGGLVVYGEGVRFGIDSAGSTLIAGTDGTSDAISSMPWLVGGLGVAVTLMSRGALVLHGSMFVFDGRGHLVLAPSRHGKSLVSAAACALGAELVAEDTVTVELGRDGEWRALPGSAVLRTRRPVDELAAWFDLERLSRSSDGRSLVRFDQFGAAVAVDRMHLIALDIEATTANSVRVDDSSSMLSCLGHLRVTGIVDEVLLDQHFEMVGALTSRVPLDLVRLPWLGDFDDLTAQVARWLASS
jgi:hypothetical protein